MPFHCCIHCCSRMMRRHGSAWAGSTGRTRRLGRRHRRKCAQGCRARNHQIRWALAPWPPCRDGVTPVATDDRRRGERGITVVRPTEQRNTSVSRWFLGCLQQVAVGYPNQNENWIYTIETIRV